MGPSGPQASRGGSCIAFELGLDCFVNLAVEGLSADDTNAHGQQDQQTPKAARNVASHGVVFCRPMQGPSRQLCGMIRDCLTDVKHDVPRVLST